MISGTFERKMGRVGNVQGVAAALKFLTHADIGALGDAVKIIVIFRRTFSRSNSSKFTFSYLKLASLP